MIDTSGDQVIYRREKQAGRPKEWKEPSAQQEVDFILNKFQYKFGDNYLEVVNIQRIKKEQWQHRFDQKKEILRQRSDSTKHWKFDELEAYPLKQEMRNKLLGDERLLELPVYVGLDSDAIVEGIAETGFASTKCRNNWFAHGHYVTTCPWYAARYGMEGCYDDHGGILDPRSKVAVGKEGRLLVCRAVMSNVYPIIRSCEEDHAIEDFADAAQQNKLWSNWYDENSTKGKAMKDGYDAHFVRVKKKDAGNYSNFQACQDEDVLKKDDIEIADELVIREEDQLLAEYLVIFHVRKEDPERLLDVKQANLKIELRSSCSDDSSTTGSNYSRSSTIKGLDSPRPVSVLLIFTHSQSSDQNYMLRKRDVLRQKGFDVAYECITGYIKLMKAVCAYEPSIIYIEGAPTGEWPLQRRRKLPKGPDMYLIEELVLELGGTCNQWSKWRGCVMNFGVEDEELPENEKILEQVCRNHPGKLHVVTWAHRPVKDDMEVLWESFFETYLLNPEDSPSTNGIHESFEEAAKGTAERMPGWLVMAPSKHPLQMKDGQHLSSQICNLLLGPLRRLSFKAEVMGDESKREQVFDSFKRVTNFPGMQLLGATVDAKVFPSPEIEMPDNMRCEDIAQFERGVLSQFPKDVRGKGIGFRGTGCFHLRMDLKAFEWLRNRVGKSDEPLYFELPMAWGGGEVRVQKVLPGDMCWFEGVAHTNDVPKICNHLLKELTKGSDQEYQECRLAATRSQVAMGSRSVRRSRPGSRDLVDVLDEDLCIICYDLLFEVVTISDCGHSFCRACLEEWTRQKKMKHQDLTCPPCRGLYEENVPVNEFINKSIADRYPRQWERRQHEQLSNQNREEVKDRVKVLQNDETHPRVFDNRLNDEMVIAAGNSRPLLLQTHDIAGQSNYHTLVHRFVMSDNCISALVFSLVEFSNPASHSRSLRLLGFWLSSVRQHAPSSRIVIIATHKDQFRKPGQIDFNSIEYHLEKVIKDIYGVESQIVLNSMDGLSFFPVDNSRTSCDDGLENLRSCIDEQCQKLVTPPGPLSKELPLRWLRLQDSLERRAAQPDDHSWVVEKRELYELAVKSPYEFAGREEIDLFLQYIVEAGVAMRVQDRIVINTNRMVRVLADIMACREEKMPPHMPAKDWFELKDKGLLTSGLAAFIMKDETKENQNLVLQALMESGIIVKFQKDKWYVPSIMPFIRDCFDEFQEPSQSLEGDIVLLIESKFPSACPSLLVQLLCRAVTDGGELVLGKEYACLTFPETDCLWKVELLRIQKPSIRWSMEQTGKDHSRVLKAIDELRKLVGQFKKELLSFGPACPKCPDWVFSALRHEEDMTASPTSRPKSAQVGNQQYADAAASSFGADVVHRMQQPLSKEKDVQVTTARKAESEMRDRLKSIGTDVVYQEALRAGTGQINTLKMIMLGEGRAGKTSTWKALVGREFDPNEDSTHGLNAERVTTRYMKDWDVLQEGQVAGVYEIGVAQSAAKLLQGKVEVRPKQRSTLESTWGVGPRTTKDDTPQKWKGPMLDTTQHRQFCKYFAKGYCKNGKDCRHLHPTADPAPPEKIVKRPLCIIIACSHEHSKAFDPLPVEENVKLMDSAFRYWGGACLFVNEKKDDLARAIDHKLRSPESEDVDSVIVHVSGHGCQSGFYCNDDKLFDFQELQEKFESKFHTLPKIYFYDCPNIENTGNALAANSLQLFSRRPGKEAYSGVDGAPFTYMLAKQINMQIAREAEVNMDILMHELVERMRINEQMVVSVCSTMTSVVVLLHPRKRRRIPMGRKQFCSNSDCTRKQEVHKYLDKKQNQVVTCDFCENCCKLHAKENESEDEEGVDLEFDDKRVTIRYQPIGIVFDPEPPCRIASFHGYGRHLSLTKGMRLTKIQDRRILDTDVVGQVEAMLERELAHLPPWMRQ